MSRIIDPFLKRHREQEALEALREGMEQSRAEREQEEKQKKVFEFFKWVQDAVEKIDNLHLPGNRKRAENFRIAQKEKLRRQVGFKYVSENPHKMKLRANRRRKRWAARQSRKRNRV